MRKKTIFLVGSDTGGHVVPVFALAKDLEADPNFRIVVIGVGSETEKRFYSTLKKSEYRMIFAGKFQFNSFLYILSVFKSAVGFFQSLALILKYRPRVVFLKGNYSTVPVAFAARLFSIPIIAHESDAVIGKSNKLISKFAKKLFVAYPVEVYENIKVKYSGSILREEYLYRDSTKDQNNSKPKILVLGGSQGAHAINELVFRSINELVSVYDLTHQTGLKDIFEAKNIKKQLPKDLIDNYHPQAFIENNHLAIIEADLIISRASSGIFEFAAFKKPVILIPYPYASLDHQVANAEFFKCRDAAAVLIEKNLTPAIFYSTISKLMASDKKRSEMGMNLFSSSKLDGEKIVKSEIIKMAGK